MKKSSDWDGSGPLSLWLPLQSHPLLKPTQDIQYQFELVLHMQEEAKEETSQSAPKLNEELFDEGHPDPIEGLADESYPKPKNSQGNSSEETIYTVHRSSDTQMLFTLIPDELNVHSSSPDTPWWEFPLSDLFAKYCII